MAKGNLFLGNGRGSVGDITLSVFNGKQLSRRRARVVANPQSASQQLQRMIMSTVTGNAARLRSLISHSFQGVRAGADSYNYFNKVNLKLLRSQAVTGQIQGFRIKGAETFVPCEGMMLGKGILSAPSISISSTGIVFDSAYLPTSFEDEQAYLKFLGDTFNAAPGDEIAVLFVRQTTSIAAEYNGFYQFKCELAMRRLVYLPWNDSFGGVNPIESQKLNPFFLDYSIGGDGKPRTIDTGIEVTSPGTGLLSMSIDNNVYVAGAAFVSHPDGQGGWDNSNTTLVVGSDVYYKQDEVTAADIQGSYGPAAAQEPVSDYYLEQSTTTEVAVIEPSAVGYIEASSFQDWDDILSNTIPAAGINVTREQLTQGTYVGLNFVPTMSRFHTSLVGAVTGISIVRAYDTSVPAGSSLMRFEATAAATTAFTGTLIFTAPDGTNVSVAVSVPAA